MGGKRGRERKVVASRSKRAYKLRHGKKLTREAHVKVGATKRRPGGKAPVGKKEGGPEGRDTRGGREVEPKDGAPRGKTPPTSSLGSVQN